MRRAILLLLLAIMAPTMPAMGMDPVKNDASATSASQTWSPSLTGAAYGYRSAAVTASGATAVWACIWRVGQAATACSATIGALVSPGATRVWTVDSGPTFGGVTAGGERARFGISAITYISAGATTDARLEVFDPY